VSIGWCHARHYASNAGRYHVTPRQRPNDRLPERLDRTHFLELLAEATERFAPGARVRLDDNHYHLLSTRSQLEPRDAMGQRQLSLVQSAAQAADTCSGAVKRCRRR